MAICTGQRGFGGHEGQLTIGEAANHALRDGLAGIANHAGRSVIGEKVVGDTTMGPKTIIVASKPVGRVREGIVLKRNVRGGLACSVCMDENKTAIRFGGTAR